MQPAGLEQKEKKDFKIASKANPAMGPTKKASPMRLHVIQCEFYKAKGRYKAAYFNINLNIIRTLGGTLMHGCTEGFNEVFKENINKQRPKLHSIKYGGSTYILGAYHHSISHLSQISFLNDGN